MGSYESFDAGGLVVAVGGSGGRLVVAVGGSGGRLVVAVGGGGDLMVVVGGLESVVVCWRVVVVVVVVLFEGSPGRVFFDLW